MGPRHRPLYHYRLSAGRWFTAADASAAVPAVVLGPAVTCTTHTSVGQTLTLDTAAGPAKVKVIGIDTGQAGNGRDVYFPLAALQRLTAMGETTNASCATGQETPACRAVCGGGGETRRGVRRTWLLDLMLLEWLRSIV